MNIPLIFFAMLFLLFPKDVFSKEILYNGTIELTNGKMIEVLTEIPSHSNDNSIKYKIDEKSEVVSLKSDLIKSLTIYLSNEISHTFYHIKYQVYDEKTNSLKLKDTKKWLSLTYNTKFMEVLSSSDEFSIGQNGKLNHNFISNFKFYVRKKEEEHCLYVYKYDDNDKYFRASLTHYCQDFLTLSQKIKKGDFTWDRIYAIAEGYSYLKENQK